VRKRNASLGAPALPQRCSPGLLFGSPLLKQPASEEHDHLMRILGTNVPPALDWVQPMSCGLGRGLRVARGQACLTSVQATRR